MTIKILIPLKALVSVMVGIVICFVAIDLNVQHARYTPGVYHRIWLDDLFHLGKEATIPAWYSAMLLALASLALFVIAAAKRNTNSKHWGEWLILALIFLYLSADESAVLHERGAHYISNRIPESPLMTFGWILPGIIVVGILGSAYVPFVLALPSRTRWLVIASGVVYLGGALVTEFVGVPYEMGREPDMGYAMLVALEEFLEMCGIILFIYTLSDYIRTQMPDLNITLAYR